ncbi:uncharacterized protein L969DRAFT_89935 [Mixia osmundae IAM 14324]|uniref:uncharacterized protein n=1 Tax=Mixia osmundae (strain CBS 9802 / IAM 14324 / JCM 22182 / KY 12970) TaxID=764103 RepID=UPI0004A5569D|nr:uncharacterized protein L969DRAFT_89935 [Mixia osmundae IAM 14324]KEI37385.1 hypothetical protein L969DRAFT_89935 [Mixia osmundae IAM 14324]
MASAAYVDHLISRLRADVDFLEKHNHLSEADAQTIRTKLRYAGTSTASTDLASTAAPSIASLTQETNNLALAVPSPPAASRLPVTPPARPALPVRSDKPRTKALWSYTGQTPDDLTFNEGDIIEVIKVENEHWERGTCLRTGQTGLYPTNHVERLPDTNRSTSSFNSIPPPPPMNTYNSYQQQQPYSAPPPPGWQGQPINEKWQPNYQQQQQQQQLQPAPPQVVVQQPPKKHGFLSGSTGNTLKHSAVGGLGFGAGSALASELVHGIF